MKKIWFRKGLVVGIITIFFSTAIMPAIGTSTLTDYELPPPIPVDMVLENAIFRRASVRVFTEDLVTDEELSTILWAAYGYRDDRKRTVPGIDGVHAAQIYVLKEDAVYKYDPLNHSLIFYKDGDYRWIGQYEAPIQVGIVWDKNESSNENYTGAEIGEIGQNIHFMANALDLGAVVTVGWPLTQIGLPSNEVAKIVIPLGHPEYPYKFVYRPMWLSFLPRIQTSDMSLTTVIQERSEPSSWEGDLTKQEQTQAIWASYGYSYLLDRSGAEKNPVKRHRTVPSAHGYYPLHIYAVTQSGIYRYIPGVYNPIYGLLRGIWILPVVSFMMKIRNGDKREEIAQASQPVIISAPLIIISVLDIEKTIRWDDLSGEQFRWLWYYEAGASAHNVLLEATAWNLSANIVLPTDTAAIRSILRLNDNYLPLPIVPVGRKK